MRALEGQGGPDGPVYLWSTRSSPCWGGCSGRRHGTLMNVMWLFLTSWLGPARIQDWSPGPWGTLRAGRDQPRGVRGQAQGPPAIDMGDESDGPGTPS